jgi:hypothetical protein
MANNLPQYQQKEQPPLISSHSTQQNDHDLGRWKSMSCIGISTKCGGFNDIQLTNWIFSPTAIQKEK